MSAPAVLLRNELFRLTSTFKQIEKNKKIWKNGDLSLITTEGLELRKNSIIFYIADIPKIRSGNTPIY